MNVTIYVNGNRVTKEELENIEIHSENISRIFSEHLRRANEIEEEQKNGQFGID